MSMDDVDINRVLYRLSKMLSDAELRAVREGYAIIDERGNLRPVDRSYRSANVEDIFLPIYIALSRDRSVNSVSRWNIFKWVSILYSLGILYMIVSMILGV